MAAITWRIHERRLTIFKYGKKSRASHRRYERAGVQARSTRSSTNAPALNASDIWAKEANEATTKSSGKPMESQNEKGCRSSIESDGNECASPSCRRDCGWCSWQSLISGAPRVQEIDKTL